MMMCFLISPAKYATSQIFSGGGGGPTFRGVPGLKLRAFSREGYLGRGKNETPREPPVLVLVSIYKGSMLGTPFLTHSHLICFFSPASSFWRRRSFRRQFFQATLLLSASSMKPRASSFSGGGETGVPNLREVRIRVPFFSVVYFSRATLPTKTGERRALLGT